jgi:hypothetical protein
MSADLLLDLGGGLASQLPGVGEHLVRTLEHGHNPMGEPDAIAGPSATVRAGR